MPWFSILGFISFLIQTVWLVKISSTFELVLNASDCLDENAIRHKNDQIVYLVRNRSFIEGNIMQDMKAINSNNQLCCGMIKLFENILSIPITISEKLVLALFIRRHASLIFSKLLIINFLRQETLLIRNLAKKMTNFESDYNAFKSITTLLDCLSEVSKNSPFSYNSLIHRDQAIFQETFGKFCLLPNLGNYVEFLFPKRKIRELNSSKYAAALTNQSCCEWESRWNIYISKIYKKPIVNLGWKFQEIFNHLFNFTALLIRQNSLPAWTLLQCAYLSDFSLSLTTSENDYKHLNREALLIGQRLFKLALSIEAKAITLRFDYK